MYALKRASTDTTRKLIIAATAPPEGDDDDPHASAADRLAEYLAVDDGVEALEAELEAEAEFLKSLDEVQRKLHDVSKLSDADRHYDFRAVRRWLFRRVLDLGYGGDEMYAFDEYIRRSEPRESGDRRIERIEPLGNKYLWIAFFEFLARMADNYYIKLWNDDAAVYDVPLQVFTPDIDPSLLLVTTHRPRFDPHPQSWWAGPPYDHWRPDLKIADWMRETTNLPDPAKALITVDSEGVEWVCLNTHLNWGEKEPLLDDRYSVPRRELWYLIFGYLVPKSEASRVYHRLRRRDFSGRTLRPEPEESYQLLWGDLYWSPAFTHESANYTASHDILERAVSKNTVELIEPATASYFRETNNDSSIDDTIRIGVPIKEIVEGLGATASAPEQGAWLNDAGDVIAFDPSAGQPGPQAVLVRRDKFEAYLQHSPYALVWMLLSEKQVVGGRSDRYYGRLVTSGAYWLKEEPLGSFHVVGGKTPRYEIH